MAESSDKPAFTHHRPPPVVTGDFSDSENDDTDVVPATPGTPGSPEETPNRPTRPVEPNAPARRAPGLNYPTETDAEGYRVIAASVPETPPPPPASPRARGLARRVSFAIQNEPRTPVGGAVGDAVAAHAKRRRRRESSTAARLARLELNLARGAAAAKAFAVALVVFVLFHQALCHFNHAH